jgi:hypothetical protein
MMIAARTIFAALAVILVAGAAPAQTPAVKDGIKNEPRNGPLAQNRDSMPKSNASPQQGSGATQQQGTPKKK